MKRKIALIALLVISIVYTDATSQSISLGIEAGVNLANVNVTPTPTVSTDTRTGIIVGGVLDISLTPSISVVSGLRYMSKGYKLTSGVQKLDVKADYLEFPILLKVKFPLTEVKPYLIGGPTIGINLSANSEFSNGTTTTTTDIKKDVESVDFGLLFGAGLDFKVATKTNLFVQFGYSLGLTNSNKDAVSVISTTVKNYGIQITGGAKFNL